MIVQCECCFDDSWIQIIIEDSAIDETSKDVIESKMIFCREHILLMYFRKAFDSEKFAKSFESESESSNDSFEDELFDIKDISNDVFERF
jgi:hypothetical protein